MQAARHNIHFAGCVCRDFYNYSTKLLYIIASFHFHFLSIVNLQRSDVQPNSTSFHNSTVFKTKSFRRRSRIGNIKEVTLWQKLFKESLLYLILLWLYKFVMQVMPLTCLQLCTCMLSLRLSTNSFVARAHKLHKMLLLYIPIMYVEMKINRQHQGDWALQYTHRCVDIRIHKSD